MHEPLIPALVVGTGFGCRTQIPALRGAGFEVAGLVGTNPERTAQRAAANGVPKSFTDLDHAIRETNSEIVAISTPPNTHGALALKALSHGCHVLCEKPFARNSAEGNDMLKAAEAAGKVHLLGNEFRFLPQTAAIARAIAEGMIGEPRLGSFVQYSGFVSAFEDGIPDWWFDPGQGGGWLGASGSHLVDQIRFWLGEFAAVSATFATVTASRGPVEDSFSARFTLENGFEGVIQQSSGAFGPPAELTRISGTKGTIWIDGATALLADSAGERELPIPPDLVLPPPPPLSDDPRHSRLEWQIIAAAELAPYSQLCRVLHAAVTGRSSPSPVAPATFADGVANMAVLDAIRASERNGGISQIVQYERS